MVVVRMRMITGTPPAGNTSGRRKARSSSNHLHFSLSFPKVRISSIGQLSRIYNLINRGSGHNSSRGLCHFLLLRWFNSSRGLAPWIFSIYLICLCYAAEAHDDKSSSLYYACEDVPTYYAGVKHLRGEALKKKLSIIISEHQSLPYKKVWDAIKILDAADVDAPEASSRVVEIYSLRTVSKSLAGKPNGWNREHLWPRSYGLTHQSLTDLHNIRPADVNVNSSRGNKYYGECSADTRYCLKPASKEAALDTETDKKIWAPPVQQRRKWVCFPRF